MKILVFADLHDEEDALEKLKAVYSSEKFDSVFILGDITLNSYDFVEQTVGAFKNCYFIPGNNEPAEVLKHEEKLLGYIHRKSVPFGKFSLAGFGMSPPTPFNTHGEMSEDEIRAGLSKLRCDSNTILLTHCPPMGYFDEVRGKHVGSTAIREFVERTKPLVHFSGHIHEWKGTDSLNGVPIVKVPAARNYEYCVAELKGKDISIEFRKLQ